ncbi:MAG: DNA (cytosine-5-)-methyltransferase [Caldilineaceae bacterium]|nr:DNA (cytosine-5-)-methyltransferase [Caldilineaceae bacterium]
MKVISLFAGIGGFDLAFERAGCTVVAQVEIDPQCRAVLAEHWPNAAQFDDVRTYHAQRGAADIVVGGFPCQDLSTAGKRAGFGGVRSSLFFEMVRIIYECRPAYVVWENVPGLLSSSNGRDFASVLMALGNIGYYGAWTMLDARFFGVAQRRRRIFGVFARGDSGARRSAEILSFAARMSRHFEPGGEAGEIVAYALAAGAGGSKFGSGRQGQDTLIAGAWIAGSKNTDENSAQSGHLIAGSLQAHSKRHGHAMTTQQAAESNQLIVGALTNRQPSSDASCVNQRHVIFESRFARNGRGAPSEIVPPLKAQSGGTGKGDGAPLVAFAWQQGVSPNDRAYPVRAGDYAGGVSASRVDAVNHPSGVRRLTPTECERLQGFPDGWTASQSDSARYRMLGNAVAVPVVEWIAQRMAERISNDK